MKWCVILLCLLSFPILGFKLFKHQDPYIPKDEQAVNRILNEVACILKKKYKMDPIATEVSMPGGIVKRLGLDFQVRGPLSKEEIRKLLIEAAEQLLSTINMDMEVRPYLEIYPFTIKNVTISLFILDSTRRRVDHPYIGIASIRRGKLDYWTLVNKNNIPKRITESEESYDEAKEKLEQ